MNHKKNAHYQSTHNALIDAMINSAGDSKRVTVNTLCDAIGINHSTFYLHFKSIDDLVLEIYQIKLDELYDIFQDNGFDLQTGTMEKLEEHLQDVEKNRSFYYLLIEKSQNSLASRDFNNKWKEYFENYYRSKGSYDEIACDLHLVACRGSLNSILKYWLDDDCQINKATIIRTIFDFCFKI